MGLYRQKQGQCYLPRLPKNREGIEMKIICLACGSEIRAAREPYTIICDCQTKLFWEGVKTNDCLVTPKPKPPKIPCCHLAFPTGKSKQDFTKYLVEKYGLEKNPEKSFNGEKKHE